MPATVLEKFNAPTAAPLQAVGLAGTLATGVGLTVMLKVVVAPVQPLAVGVTTILPVMAEMPALVPANAGMLVTPVADVASPMALLLFVQL